LVKWPGSIEHLANANQDAHPELARLALKLATGAGKTPVMALLIARQTGNAVRHPQRRRFRRGFLVNTPGPTMKERRRVLQPNDPDSYYARRELDACEGHQPSSEMGAGSHPCIVVRSETVEDCCPLRLLGSLRVAHRAFLRLLGSARR
jgi:hypothetical protein